MQLILLLVIFVLQLAYSGLLLYYRSSWLAIPSYSIPAGELPATRVTIIIPARNEEANIIDCLTSILRQDYPSDLLQVIVVDDHSTDNTISMVEKFPLVMLVKLSDHVRGPINSYKKKAIETALAFSTGEIIISTDADCIVNSLWIRTLVSFYSARNAKFIVMPVCFSTDRTFFNKFQELDFMSLQGITGAAVSRKSLNMCNGANMAYSAEAFKKVEGFKNIDHIASGDDMLLMQKISMAFPGEVHFLKSKEVIVRTKPMGNLSGFINQRIRWASKADQYTDQRITAVLMVVYLLNFSLLLLPVFLIFRNSTYNFGSFHLAVFQGWLLLLALKTITELYFLFPVATFFGRKKLLVWFPFAQPFHILYTVIAGWLGKFGKYQWKGRTVK